MVKKMNRSPYLWGALTGFLIIVGLLLIHKFFGASTSYARMSWYVLQLFSPEWVANNAYFAKYIKEVTSDIIANWQVVFVVGIAIGAFIASLWNREFSFTALPKIWKEKHGKSISKRLVVAFVGGMLAIFGVRLAGWCPSGHGLSGIAQLSLSGFLAMIVFFVVGVITAHLFYHKKSK